MELRHLRYFVSVAEGLSFRKAAERLGVSRPALSKQIKDLEREIGVRLMERDTVSVSLTKAGEVFLKDSREILIRAEQAVRRAAEAQNGHRGTLRIGSVGMIATEFLPKTLKRFHERYPGSEVEFVEMLPQEQLDALREGTIDIGFAYGQDAGGRPDQLSLCVIRSKFGIAVSKQHPWTDRKSIPLREISHIPVLCLGQGQRSAHQEDIVRFCADEGFTPSMLRQIEGIDSLFTLIAADQGVSLLPTVLDLAVLDITILPLQTIADCDFRMWAVWQRENASPMVTHFIQLLDERNRGLGI